MSGNDFQVLDQKMLLELIPGDMLKYSEIMKCYTLFSDEEMENMVNNCIEAGVDASSIVLFISEVSNERLLDLLEKRIADGFVSCKLDKKTKKLFFEPINEER